MLYLAYAFVFAVELWAWALCMRAGVLAVNGAAGWVLGIALAITAIVIWSLFAAPKAVRRLSGWWLFGFKFAYFLAIIAGVAAAGDYDQALLLALIATPTLCAMSALGFDDAR